jgi:polysaccharide export outer membrane protein
MKLKNNFVKICLKNLENIVMLCGLCCIIFCSCAKNTHTNINVPVNNVPVNTDSKEIARAVEKQRNEYILQKGDLIEVKIFKEPNMDREIRITSNGFITMPLVGIVRVAGGTVFQAERRLKMALRKYIKDPCVNILIKEYGNASVSVLGQVESPKSIQMPPEKKLTLLEAISSAGGFNALAAVSEVKILRIEKGIQKTMIIDVTEITKKGQKDKDILLMPGDVVFVPQSLF